MTQETRKALALEIDAQSLKDAAELTIPRMEKALEAVLDWDHSGLVNQAVVTTMAEAYLHHRRTLSPTPDQWMPIETAPMTGHADLLWGGKRFTDCYRDPLDHGWRHMTHYNQLIMVNSPEYWMPTPQLPQPPQDKKE